MPPPLRFGISASVAARKIRRSRDSGSESSSFPACAFPHCSKQDESRASPRFSLCCLLQLQAAEETTPRRSSSLCSQKFVRPPALPGSSVISMPQTTQIVMLGVVALPKMMEAGNGNMFSCYEVQGICCPRDSQARLPPVMLWSAFS